MPHNRTTLPRHSIHFLPNRGPPRSAEPFLNKPILPNPAMPWREIPNRADPLPACLIMN